jgi:DNA-binding PucR family transcriptional regulator
MSPPQIRTIDSRSESSGRLRAVRRVLAGANVREVLGYPLDSRHLASVAWGRSPLESLRVLAWELSADLLSVQVDERTAWGWVEFSNTPEGDLRRRLRGFTPPAGCVATGALAAGPEGFRESHLQALGAGRVARMSGAALTLYDDVALEALALQDVEGAHRFVRHVLADLVEENPRARDLLATLRAYFAAGQHASSAAAMLGVHERTVGPRLRAVEARLGERTVTSMHAELELALRLHDLLT